MRPNILLFLSDQQRADTVPGECFEGLHIPHLEWLARRGETYRRAYCPAIICAPSRASILTGHTAHTHGVHANYQPNGNRLPFRKDLPTMGDLLKEAGYRCGYFGKWHLPTGNRRPGFPDGTARLSYWDTEDPADDEAIAFARNMGVELGDRYTSYLQDPGSPDKSGGRATRLPLALHPSTLMAQRAAGFVRESCRQSDPFFAVCSCIEPHPLGLRYDIAPAPFDRMYDPADMPLPETLHDPGAPELLRGRNFRGLKPADRFSDLELRRFIAGYYGAVSYTDYLLGLVLEPIIAAGKTGETLVVFSSDHGEMLGAHGMLKKGPVMYEDLTRVPLVVMDPRRKNQAGTRHAHPVSLLDLAPTFLQAAGRPLPADLPGRPLPGPPDARGVMVEYHSSGWGEPPMPLRAWITEEWKYVEAPDGGNFLFNLKTDPYELENRSDDPDCRGIKLRLARDLKAFLQKIGDPWPQVPKAERPLPPPTGEWHTIRRPAVRR